MGKIKILLLRIMTMIGKLRLLTFSGLILAVVPALLLIAARPANAQAETLLYSFSFDGSYPDGAQPTSRLTSDSAGNFYGTTADGGLWGYGTVFEVSPNGDGGWNETVLYSFCPDSKLACPDGWQPISSVIFDKAGNLYGTAYVGGAHGYGVVFELSHSGGGWTQTVLYNFAGGADGAYPINGLIFDLAGNLYGATCAPGGAGGTVFTLIPTGAGWTEQTIYNMGTNQGINAGLTIDGAGNIYGVSASTVFKLSPSGDGGWASTIIHTFPSRPKDGVYPEGTLAFDKAGNLYGTTFSGGRYNYGTVYELTPAKKGRWTERILHAFKNSPKDGGGPAAGIVFDPAGNIYGTTEGGGRYQVGSVYELSSVAGKDVYREKLLWNFNNADGQYPIASLTLDGAGNLYGTTSSGGPQAQGPLGGVVFEVTP
jgi:uncharacterized repeat protein (TIGR03803 family)